MIRFHIESKTGETATITEQERESFFRNRNPMDWVVVAIETVPTQKRKIYIIGSLRNPCIPQVAKAIREAIPYAEVFDDWYAAGPEADDYWKKYEQERGRSYQEALQGHAAKNVFAFDKRNIDEATDVVLVMPAGKSGHLEFGYSVGQGKNSHVLLEPDVDRWDVMYQFASGVHHELEDLIEALKGS